MCPRKFDWSHTHEKIMKVFGERLEKGEHVIIREDESHRYLGESIKNSMPDKCILEEGDNPENVTGTVSRHLGQLGFSNRLGQKEGKKYIELWIGQSDKKRPTTKATTTTFGSPVIDEFQECEKKMRNSTLITYSDMHLIPDKSGVYTAWMNDKLLYVGRSTKLKNRISAHFSGKRGGDKFCVYVFDEFLFPDLCKENTRLSTEQMDKRTANWICQNVKFRWVEAGRNLLTKLEKTFRKEWKPLLNPNLD